MMLKSIFAVCICVLTLFTGCSTGTNAEFDEKYQYILHAGGVTPDGIVGSNSIEALDHSYELGFRVLEIDFCWTEDGGLACVHDWDAYYASLFGKKTITMAEFESVRCGQYGFTSIALEHLAEWMEQHPDAVIVTDIKERNQEGVALIAREYPELRDQFCVQIYAADQYDAVYDLGFENIILTVYQMSWEAKTDTDALIRFAKTHTLRGITFPVALEELAPGYIKAMRKANVPLFVHTINDAQQQQELFAMGVSGVYTDVGIGQ